MSRGLHIGAWGEEFGNVQGKGTGILMRSQVSGALLHWFFDKGHPFNLGKPSELIICPQAYPDGYPEKILPELGAIAALITINDTKKWNISSADTLAALLSTEPPEMQVSKE